MVGLVKNLIILCESVCLDGLLLFLKVIYFSYFIIYLVLELTVTTHTHIYNTFTFYFHRLYFIKS